jgi:hypothetical protein
LQVLVVLDLLIFQGKWSNNKHHSLVHSQLATTNNTFISFLQQNKKTKGLFVSRRESPHRTRSSNQQAMKTIIMAAAVAAAESQDRDHAQHHGQDYSHTNHHHRRRRLARAATILCCHYRLLFASSIQ